MADLAQSGFRAVLYFHNSGLTPGVTYLDSFSEPSMAVAILKQEAEKLMMNYTQARDEASTLQVPMTVQPAPSVHSNHSAFNPSTIQFRGFARGSPLETSSIQPIERLHAAVRDLEIELELKLLVIDWENSFEHELVDGFLLLLRQAPENLEALEWLPTALDSAQHCGRTEEVEDALQEALLFHPHLKTAVQMRSKKEEWDRGHQAAHNSP
jgi:hypothetical protein